MDDDVDNSTHRLTRPMTSTPDSTDAVLTVGELNRLARSALERSITSCWVGGEISNFNRAASGHWYFTLKDSEAAARCVMFRTRNQFVDWNPRDGDQVELRVQPTLYEPRGDYQLFTDAMRKAGQGSLFEAFLRLKAKLEAEGLFARERKRAVPRYPKTIGIITSPQAAALRDVLITLRARWPSCSVIVYPTPVQGIDAVQGISQSISSAARHGQCDVLLLVRGGGSLEDLLGFNDEATARAIAASTIPIITGIGHETDFSIADFVADLRGPTPTAAAQLATPSASDLFQHLFHLHARLGQALSRKTNSFAQSIDGLKRRLVHPEAQILFRRQRITHTRWRLLGAMQQASRTKDEQWNRLWCRMRHPGQAITDVRQRLTKHSASLDHAIHEGLRSRQETLISLSAKLELLSPVAVLGRGYSLVRDGNGRIIHRSDQLAIGQLIHVTLASGGFSSEVRKIEGNRS